MIGTPAEEYFVDGGTLDPEAPSYVQRLADDELFNLLNVGELCYILTARQMGKSSLMVRTERRLRTAGVSTSVIDLTSIGSHDIDSGTFYLGLLTKLCRDLRLNIDLQAWWDKFAGISPGQRFTDFLRDIALPNSNGPLIIFIDEIDSTLKFELRFRDDFFATIRAFYNRRASEPELARLTFALIGAATPSDLISNPQRTPFNIGRRIDLLELERTDAEPLRIGLEVHHPHQGDKLLNQIFYWTGGQPYLTQRLCKLVAETSGPWDNIRLDNLVETEFFSDTGRKDPHLALIQDRVAALPVGSRRRLLSLYRQVYRGKSVVDNRRSVEQSYLELFGLVRVVSGVLQPRNQIYERIFDETWIRANSPTNRRTTIAFSMAALTLISIIAAVWIAFSGSSINKQAALFEQQFDIGPTKAVRLNALAKLIALSPGDDVYDQRALELFYDSPYSDFDLLVAGPDAVSVTARLAHTLDPEKMPGWSHLVERMVKSLSEQSNETKDLTLLLDRWRSGHEALIVGNAERAVKYLSMASDFDDTNLALRYDLAMAYLAAGNPDKSLLELNNILFKAINAPPTPTVESSETTTSTMSDNQTAVILTSTALASTTLAAGQTEPTLDPSETSSPEETPQTLDGATPNVRIPYANLRFRNTASIIETVRQTVFDNPALLIQYRNNPSSYVQINNIIGETISRAQVETAIILVTSSAQSESATQTAITQKTSSVEGVASTFTSTITAIPSIAGTSASLNPTIVTTAPTTTAATPTRSAPVVIVTTDSLRMRTGPGAVFPIIMRYGQGEQLLPLGRSTDSAWILARDGSGNEGWLSIAFVTLTVDMASLPIITSPPTPTLQPTNTPPPAPTATPRVPINIDGLWVGPIGPGGTINLTILNQQITRVNFEYSGASPSLEGACEGASPNVGWGSTINQLRISIGADGSFRAGPINVRNGNTVRQLSISGTINANGTGAGQLEEVFPDFPIPGCTQRASFTWSVNRQ